MGNNSQGKILTGAQLPMAPNVGSKSSLANTAKVKYSNLAVWTAKSKQLVFIPEFGQILTEFYEKLIRSSTCTSCNQIHCMPDFIILAQVRLQIFCSQSCFTMQNAKVRKGR